MRIHQIFRENVQSPVSDGFLASLRQWGDNTVFDRSSKMDALLRYEAEAAHFRQVHEWLYRGHQISFDELKTLRGGGIVELDLPVLSSWSADADHADTFARFGDGEANILIMKRGLDCFFDFRLLGIALERAGIEVAEDEYDLHDPIREQEVIVRSSGPLRITKKDVMVAYYFTSSGRQRRTALR